jgi:hypothetical protein
MVRVIVIENDFSLIGKTEREPAESGKGNKLTEDRRRSHRSFHDFTLNTSH